MKTIFLSLLVFAALQLTAQDEKYYDWDWQPCKAEDARFMSLTDKTDSGWLRRDFYLATQKLQMQGLYKDSEQKTRNGWFSYYHPNEMLSSEGRYVNGKKEGLWLSYHYNGMMEDSVVYEKDEIKSRMAWWSNGGPSLSVVNQPDGSGVQMGWFDDGQPSFSGRTSFGKKEKRWQYFHKTGKLAGIEEYEQDKLLSRIYYNEAGVQLADTTNRDRGAMFKGDEKKWQSFLTHNLEFPADVTIVNADKITVVVIATIDEEGNVTDAYVSVPMHPKFDDEALRVFKRSPKWSPAISHNRRVKQYIRQPITFGQYED